MNTLHIEERQLILICDTNETLDKLVKSAKYKIRLNRYVDNTNNNYLYFKDSLTIHEIKTIIQHLQSIIPNIDISKEIDEYIDDRSYFIEKRYRLGNDIKKRDEKYTKQFEHFSSVLDTKMVRPLTEEQQWNAFYMSVMKFVSNFSVPGSGKTATVLGTYAYLKELDIIDRIVMIGPKTAFGSWIDEYKICFGVEDDDFYVNIHDEQMNSTSKRKYALRFESGNKPLILLNYESLQSLETAAKEVLDKRTLLVFDEVHKIKNPHGQRAQVSKTLSENVGAIIALTGTPIPNSYVDIYNVLNILYREDYKDFFGFSINELKRAQAQEIERINEKIKPFFCRISKEDLRVPKPNEDMVLQFTATEAENKLFKILYQTYKNNLFALLVRIFQLESNPKLLLQQIDKKDLSYIVDDESDFSEDISVKDYSEDITGLVEQIDVTTKTKKTLQLLKQLQAENKKTIVWCTFVSSIKQIEQLCNENGIQAKCIYGEVALEDRIQLINAFRNGDYDVLITNPHTLAESVSLHSVCHDAIYYEYSFNLVHLLQSKDRIHRLGLPQDQYTQYYFMNGAYVYNNEHVSITDRIYNRLKEKEQTMLEAVNNDILEHVTTEEEDIEVIFQDLLKNV